MPGDVCSLGRSRGSPEPRPPASAGSMNRPSIPCPSWRACRDRWGCRRPCPTSSVSPCGRMPAAGRSTSNCVDGPGHPFPIPAAPAPLPVARALRPTSPWSPRGPILVCARPLTPSEPLPAGGTALDEALVREPWRLRLHHATPTGRWHPFAEARCGSTKTRMTPACVSIPCVTRCPAPTPTPGCAPCDSRPTTWRRMRPCVSGEADPATRSRPARRTDWPERRASGRSERPRTARPRRWPRRTAGGARST